MGSALWDNKTRPTLGNRRNKYFEIKWIKKFVDVEGNLVPSEYATQRIGASSVKMYNGTIRRLFKLERSTRHLLDYILEFLSADMMVQNGKLFRLRFSDYMRELSHGKYNYADSTVASSFNDLVRNDILVRLDKSLYKVNSEFFYVGGEQERLREVKILLTIKNNKPMEVDIIMRKSIKRMLKNEFGKSEIIEAVNLSNIRKGSEVGEVVEDMLTGELIEEVDDITGDE